MSDTKLNEFNLDLGELKSFLQGANRKRTQDLLAIEIRKVETEIIKIKDAQKAQLEKSIDPQTSSSVKSENKHYQVKLNGYGWDQSDKYIKVYVTLKDVQNVPKDKVYCKLTEKSMELYVDNLDNKDYILVINNLLEPIDVAKCHWKQKTDMVVVFLAKSNPSQWTHMTEIEKKFQEQRDSRLKPPEPGSSADPQENLMSLFKNFYESGDDDTKRMIAKAWHEGQQNKIP